MSRFSVVLTLLALFCWAAPAQAQATRTWVSGVGDDANPCSRTAPCKTFAGAISKTASAGEIDCLDPGGFGGLTITKSITLLCGQSGVGGVLVSGTAGISVTAGAGTRVVLDGLDIEGAGLGTIGVSMTGLGQLIVRNSTIRNFTGSGINIASPASTPAPRLVVQNSFITNNAGGGINVSSSAANNVEILDTVIDSNTTFNLQVAGPSTVVLSGSTLTGTNPNSIVISGGGALISYGNNVLRNGGAPTSTMPLQ